MKTIVLTAAVASALCGFAGSASAQVYGDTARVVSATPIHDRVTSPRRECHMEQVTAYEEQRTVREAEPDRVPVTREVQRCDTIADAREVVVGYDVRYEYNGHEFRTRLAYDPGPQIPVNVEVRPPQERPQERPQAAGPRTPVYRGTY